MLKLGRYWPWKTVSSHFHMPVRPMLLHRPSCLFNRFVKIWATCKKFLGKWFTAPPWPKIARTPMIKCDGLRRERMLKWTILSFDVVQLRWTELLEGWPLGAEVTFMVVDSNVDGAARWGRRIRQNSIRNCFDDGIIDVILNIWWDRRGFLQIDYVCWNFRFRWKRRCRKTGRTSQLSASLSTEST